MRLLHVVPTYVPAWRHGGPVRAVHGLCKALAARGHEVTVFTTDVDAGGPPLDRTVAIDGLAVRYFAVAPPRRLYRAPAMAAALDREVPACDAVHLHSVFLWPTAAAARAAAWAGVPYLVAPRGMLVPELIRRRGRLRKLAWLGLVERRTLGEAAALHATSSLEADEATRLAGRIGLPLPPAVVVANGVEDEPAPASDAVLAPSVRAALARRPLLLFLGRVSWKKGLDRLIRALPRILPRIPEAPEATLAIAGNDDEGLRPELERLAAEAGVADRILFLGEVLGADKAALLHGADVLVLASYSENFGNAVLEAMAAGCPVAVTPEVGLAGVVRATGAGIVVEGDPASLSEALADLLDDPAARRAMGERGAAAARERFGWDVVARDMEAVYRDLLTRRPLRPGGAVASGAITVELPLR